MHTIAYPITFFVSEKLKYFEQKVKVNLAVFDLMSKHSSTSTSTRSIVQSVLIHESESTKHS